MKSIKLLLAVGVIGTALLAISVPAQASHKTCVRHPSDGPAGDRTLACVETDHTTVSVCDHDADGHRVYARYWVWATDRYALTGYDPDGAWGACGSWRVAFAYWVRTVAVCVQYEGCSAWKDV